MLSGSDVALFIDCPEYVVGHCAEKDLKVIGRITIIVQAVKGPFTFNERDISMQTPYTVAANLRTNCLIGGDPSDGYRSSAKPPHYELSISEQQIES